MAQGTILITKIVDFAFLIKELTLNGVVFNAYETIDGWKIEITGA